jgi:hypothetical protein
MPYQPIRNPIINGQFAVNTNKIGHHGLKYAREHARELEKAGYKTLIVKDKKSWNYFVFRSKSKIR